MDATTIARHRLHNHHITQPRFQTPSEVVGWLGAIQGQDYAGAKWSIGLRLPGSTDTLVEHAFDTRAIVRSWLLRGTLHVAAGDLGWMLDLIAPRVIAGNARRYRELELDDATLARSNDILAAALRDGAQRERGELLAILEQHGISTTGQRATYMLQRASLDRLICQGAARRNKPTFYAIDHLPGRPRTLARDEALAELARRYFTSRGPATLQDFIWWSGLTANDARAGLESIRADLVEETVNGTQTWRPPSEPPAGELPPVLLPGFDEYLLGYQDRSAVLDPRFAQRVVPGGNGMFSPTIVIGGRVVGTWKRDVKKSAVIMTPQPFEPLSDEDLRAFDRAAQPYGAFMELPVMRG